MKNKYNKAKRWQSNENKLSRFKQMMSNKNDKIIS
jgi:hypothetical protein